MTDRIHSITLVLDQDMREDDARALLTAVCMFKGVINASANVADIALYTAEARARHEYGQRLLAVVYPGAKA